MIILSYNGPDEATRFAIVGGGEYHLEDLTCMVAEHIAACEELEDLTCQQP